jgi:hypothetical protein
MLFLSLPVVHTDVLDFAGMCRFNFTPNLGANPSFSGPAQKQQLEEKLKRFLEKYQATKDAEAISRR